MLKLNEKMSVFFKNEDNVLFNKNLLLNKSKYALKDFF